MELDLVIENGVIVDGSGLPAYPGDIGIKDGKIVSIGDLRDSAATRRIDAAGRVVAPGFIDPHTHLDAQLVWDPFGLPSLLHGVTTVMTGNCGVSVAPCRADDRKAVATLFHMTEEVPLDTLLDGFEWKWESFGEYLAHLDGSLGINVAAMVGHSVLRYYVMGAESYQREARPDEIEAMRDVLRASMEGGAAGFSTSGSVFALGQDGQPVPSRVATREELFAICDVLGEVERGVFETDGGVGTHLFADHVDNVAGPIAQRTGRPALLGSTVYERRDPANWVRVMQSLSDSWAKGGRVYGQSNPGPIWVRFSMERPLMFEDLPAWRGVFNLPTREEKLAAFADPAVRDQLQFEGVDATTQCFFARDWENVTIVETPSGKNSAHLGKTVAALAAEQGKRVIDALLDLVIDENIEARFLYPAANFGDDAAVATMLKSPLTIMGSSDAGAHVKTLCGAGDTSLLFSRWVRDTGALPLEEAVRRVTHDQAVAIGLRQRGLLRPGYAADVVVFRPDDIEYLTPHWVNDLPGGAARLWRDAPGIDYVVVNGGVAVADGKLMSDVLHGRVLGGDTLLY